MNTKKLLLAILLGLKTVTLFGSEEEDKRPTERHLSLGLESQTYKKCQLCIQNNRHLDPNIIAASFALQYARRENNTPKINHNEQKKP